MKLKTNKLFLTTQENGESKLITQHFNDYGDLIFYSKQNLGEVATEAIKYDYTYDKDGYILKRIVTNQITHSSFEEVYNWH